MSYSTCPSQKGTRSCGAAIILAVRSLCNGSSPSRYEVFAHLDSPMSFLPQVLLCCCQPWAGRKAQGGRTALPFLMLTGCIKERASKASKCFGCALAMAGVVCSIGIGASVLPAMTCPLVC